MNADKVKRILKRIGYTHNHYDYRDYKNQFQIRCFFADIKDENGVYFHEDGEDNHFSMGIKADPSEDDATTNCLACGNSGSLSYLLYKAHDLTGNEKFKKAQEMCNDVSITDVKTRIEDIFENEKYMGEEPEDNKKTSSNVFEETEDRTFDDSELDIFEKAIHPYMIEERDFSVETLKKFELHYDEKLNRVVIPVRTRDEKLAGLVGRSVISEEKREEIAEKLKNDKPYKVNKYTKKYYNYLNFQKAEFLFGINHISEDKDKIVVVEGCTDVMRFHEYGMSNCVGVFGHSISRTQQKKLMALEMDIYLMLDPDNAGERGKENARKSMADRTRVFRCDLPGKDPDDCTKDELKDVLNNARLIV